MTDENFIRTDRNYIKNLLPPRPKNGNKGTFGTVLNFAGSIYYSGAAYLSSIAALKVGCGLVRLASENEVISRISVLSPDITFINLGENEYGTLSKDSLKYIKNLKRPNAISIGCGLTTFPPAKEFVLKFLESHLNSDTPIVIDADAINILACENKKPVPLNSVITPHPLELSRLLKVDADEIENNRIKFAKKASGQFDCIVVLKGKNTVISTPNGNTFVNSTGNTALSKGGSGDVLTGMIAGFAAQGMKLEDACVLACYLHGKAGEIASYKLSEYSVLASDLVNFIPNAIKEFTQIL